MNVIFCSAHFDYYEQGNMMKESNDKVEDLHPRDVYANRAAIYTLIYNLLNASIPIYLTRCEDGMLNAVAPQTTDTQYRTCKFPFRIHREMLDRAWRSQRRSST